MTKQTLEAIDALVEEIYTPDQAEIMKRFSDLTEALIGFVEKMQEAGYFVDLTQELTTIQQSFEKKDYLKLADYLLYDVKSQFEELNLD